MEILSFASGWITLLVQVIAVGQGVVLGWEEHAAQGQVFQHLEQMSAQVLGLDGKSFQLLFPVLAAGDQVVVQGEETNAGLGTICHLAHTTWF